MRFRVSSENGQQMAGKWAGNLMYTYLPRQVDVHGCVCWPVTHRQDAYTQVYTACQILVLDVLQKRKVGHLCY